MFVHYVLARNGKLWNPKNDRLVVALAGGRELDRGDGSGRNS